MSDTPQTGQTGQRLTFVVRVAAYEWHWALRDELGEYVCLDATLGGYDSQAAAVAGAKAMACLLNRPCRIIREEAV